MLLLIVLVFGIALLGVTSIRALDRSVNQELSLLLGSTDLGNGLVASVASEIRSAEQYLVRPNDRLRASTIEDGDSAYAFQLRYRGLGSLTTADRYIVNKIAANQAQIEVAYGMAHALTDLGRRQAFDVTPHRFITGIITERGILREPYTESLRGAFEDGVPGDFSADGDDPCHRRVTQHDQCGGHCKVPARGQDRAMTRL